MKAKDFNAVGYNAKKFKVLRLQRLKTFSALGYNGKNILTLKVTTVQNFKQCRLQH
jgi:hypothetical protein